MIKNNKWFFLVCFSGVVFTSHSQNSNTKNYVIITYQQKNTKGIEKVKRTYWITPEDSIYNIENKFFPLLLSGYFKNDLDSCCAGKGIDPYFSSHTIENYLDSGQEKALNNLQTIIFNKRKKLQTIVKKWSSGNTEEVTIYATSISGLFCFCEFHITGQIRSVYSDLLYIPYSEIQANDKFWNSEKSKLIMNFDFYKYNFNYNILYNIFPEWRKYGKNQ